MKGTIFIIQNRLPIEIVASILASTTILISLPPINLPGWAIFVSWAATFAAGGPKKEIFKKIYPTMLLGAIIGMVVIFIQDILIAPYLSTNWSIILSDMIILFIFNALMISLHRLKLFAFIPGMFFGFVSFFVAYYGGWGPIEGNLFSSLITVIIMNALGPIYAWLTVHFSA